MQKIYCLEFDGTITKKDTLLEFISFAKGKFGLLGGFMLYSPWLILMRLHLYPNYRIKQRIFSFYFKGARLETFNRLCHNFAVHRSDLIRPQAKEYIEKAVLQGHRVWVVSASIDNWVVPFFSEMDKDGLIQVLGTQIEVKEGMITGRFLTKNCYGPEKVNRIKNVLKAPRNQYEIIAFGDSRGDKEMLAYANQGFFKPFR